MDAAKFEIVSPGPFVEYFERWMGETPTRRFVSSVSGGVFIWAIFFIILYVSMALTLIFAFDLPRHESKLAAIFVSSSVATLGAAFYLYKKPRLLRYVLAMVGLILELF